MHLSSHAEPMRSICFDIVPCLVPVFFNVCRVLFPWAGVENLPEAKGLWNGFWNGSVAPFGWACMYMTQQ